MNMRVPESPRTEYGLLKTPRSEIRYFENPAAAGNRIAPRNVKALGTSLKMQYVKKYGVLKM